MNYLREIRAAQRKHIALTERARKSDGTAVFVVAGIGILGLAGYFAYKASKGSSSTSTNSSSSSTPDNGGWLQISPPGGMVPAGARFAIMLASPTPTETDMLSRIVGASGSAALALPGSAFPSGQGWPFADDTSSFRGMATNTTGAAIPANPPAQVWIYVPA